MNILLDFISKLGTLMVIFSVLYFIYDFILCKVFKLNKYIIFNKIYLSDILNIPLIILTIVKFFKISSPYI